ncbi:molybdate ABC transporter permease subunit [Pseudoflavonifractor phocaeensis]|uniref:molybdate ABC transporter permease subunit n=1 Tax=Pseudoflavonifractor phocaeensis TaxID=1870988 RepID=UPI00313D33E6
MDWFPLLNSLRIAAISTVCVFFLGILAAYYVARLPRVAKGLLDCLLTLPLVLPPTVVGFFLLKLLGPKTVLGAWLLDTFALRVTMTWPAAIFAVIIVTFPLMYRTARGAFEAFDPNLLAAGRTLGRSNPWVFWRVLMPGCREGLMAGTVLAFARGLGEYGATSMVSGYTPGKTATIATTVYQLWREGNDVLAYRWVAVNVGISLAVLLAVNLLERREKRDKWPAGAPEV